MPFIQGRTYEFWSQEGDLVTGGTAGKSHMHLMG